MLPIIPLSVAQPRYTFDLQDLSQKHATLITEVYFNLDILPAVLEGSFLEQQIGAPTPDHQWSGSGDKSPLGLQYQGASTPFAS